MKPPSETGSGPDGDDPRKERDEAAVVRALERIDAWEAAKPSLGAFLSVVDRSDAVQAARRAAEGPLRGIPVAVKDNLATVDLPTTCASRILKEYCSPFEATVVRRLREAGGVVVGKTNLDEFAMGSSTENSAFGPTRNPHDLSRVPGGSSGGSAAAVAAEIVPAALGSDTGGSVRQPAAFCGVVGIKPTYGRVSRYGLVAFASSLDQVGALGRRVEDAARLLQAVAGPDPRDATCAARPVPDLVAACQGTGGGVEGVTVGVPREYFPDELELGVRTACEEALEVLERAGAELREVSLRHTRLAIPTYYVVASAEASSNLARFDGVRYGHRSGSEASEAGIAVESRSRGFGAEVKRRILLGTYALSAGYYEAYYGRATTARRQIAGDFRRLWQEGIDLLFTPTSPGPAFTLGSRIDDPYAMYRADVFTVPANLAGLPALSLPVGTSRGLPVGGQLLAPRWGEELLIGVAAALERALDLRLEPPQPPSVDGDPGTPPDPRRGERPEESV